MTASVPARLTVRALLERQAFLQETAERRGQRAFSRLEWRAAHLAEVGEVLQAAKGLWAWWRKAGQAPLAPQLVLDEVADVLHFVLLLELQRMRRPWYRGLVGALLPLDAPISGRVLVAQHGAVWCALGLGRATRLTQVLPLAYGLVSYFGFSPDDLARAYWRKSEENLRRWEEVTQIT